MYRTALRSSPSAARALRVQNVLAGSRRFLATGPTEKKRTWKGAAFRWGVAIGAVYFYNTSPLFAEEELPSTHPAPPQFSDSELSTVDAIVEEKRRKALAAPPPPPSSPPPATEEKPQSETTDAVPFPAEEAEGTPEPGSPEALEQEAQQQGAFDPETGEINWDCPCLGGMAHGPCGEEFKAAFSCFVYSKEEPKGMDCIDKFQHMQDCFRKYPDVYGAELADDEDEDAPAAAPEGVEIAGAKQITEKPAAANQTLESANAAPEKPAVEASSGEQQVAKKDHPVEVPKSAFDATDANKVSYAEIASKGPKQTPEEAAAPQPPQIEVASESVSSSSLIDVDMPSVHTVPSDFKEQEIKTETQAARIEHDKREKELVDKARAEADLAKKKARRKAHQADNWMSRKFEGMSEETSWALLAGNALALAGISSVVGYKAYGLYSRGLLDKKAVAIGLGVVGLVGAFESVFLQYFKKSPAGRSKP
ncbi:mitochondrial intermembrane space import and assembly protein 40 [Rhypophila decipiens]|uniref:Mitochondrial intermembrane space import and assembly protein 40 n=1 Tax=Rhypophila decipiens TaxID=261697 RepID=A0AAN7B9V6_9PEZI|nr:mitochondrial intermembrane space import and assembly protein 40 [Rhypophila decipiens]